MAYHRHWERQDGGVASEVAQEFAVVTLVTAVPVVDFLPVAVKVLHPLSSNAWMVFYRLQPS